MHLTVRNVTDPRAKAINDAATACVRRLMEIGLPEQVALVARDAVAATVDNMLQRQRCGEFEPK